MRHNHACRICARALGEVSNQVIEGEVANWLSGNRQLRPYDMAATQPVPTLSEQPSSQQPLSELVGFDVGVADPTRVGRLPRGTPYYQRGDAAVRMQNRKYRRHSANVNRFGPLTRQVKFVPLVFEVTGSRGPKAQEYFSLWCKQAAEKARQGGGKNYRAAGRDHTWNAMKFAALYSQMLSFAIVRDTALTVMRAVERAARLQSFC